MDHLTVLIKWFCRR